MVITFVSIMESMLITQKDLTAISKKLSARIPQWAKKVADAITTDVEWKSHSNNPCTANNARHIAYGKIKSQLHRRLFMKHGAKLLLGEQNGVDKVRELVSQVQ